MADTPKSADPDPNAALQAAIDDPQVPKIYSNSFGVGLTNADIFIVFQRFGPKPVAIVNLSYTLAKTLAQRLGTLVAEFETSVAGQSILTTDRIDDAMKANKEGKAKGEPDEVH